MDHREYKRIVPGAGVAVLFLHGIVSTPRHFDPFLELVPEDVSAWALLLDGHGKEVPDFGKIYHTRKELKKLQTTALVYQSTKDELVSIRSMKYLKANSYVSAYELKNSLHSYYDEQDLAFLIEEFRKFSHNFQ